MSKFARRLIRPLLGILVVGLVGPAAALATEQLTLTPGDFTDGVPATVTASGSVDPDSVANGRQGRLAVFRVQATTCPSYSQAYAQGVNLDPPNTAYPNNPKSRTITSAGSFSYTDQNSGTQTPGTSYVLCGYLDTYTASTTAATASYTVPGGTPPPPQPKPTVTTGDASGGDGGRLYLNGTVNPRGDDTHYHFDYGTTTSYGQTAGGTQYDHVAGTSTQSVSDTTAALPAGTTIHYRIVATNSGGTSTGGDRVVTTPGGVPTVTTGGASGITPDAFTLSGSYNPHGSDYAYFEYTGLPVGYFAVGSTPFVGSVPAAEASQEHTISQTVPAGFDGFVSSRLGTGEISGRAALAGFKPTLSIRYRLVVGETAGAWKTITSRAPSKPPAVSTGAATLLHCSEGPCLKLNGAVNDQGQGYSYSAFEIGPTPSYGYVSAGSLGVATDAQGTIVPSSSAPHAVSTYYNRYPAPGATVHYRVLASNGTAAIVKGPDRTFTVPDGPSKPGGPSKTTILSAVSKALTPTGKAAKIAAILKAKAYPAKFTAPSAGTATIAWYQVPKGAHVAKAKKPVLVAKGTKKTSKKGKTTLKVKLTKKGKTLLKKVKKHHKLKLTAKGPSSPRAARRSRRRRRSA